MTRINTLLFPVFTLFFQIGTIQAQDEAITIDPGWEDSNPPPGENPYPVDPVNTVVLQSPIVTNWGRWGSWAHCSMTHSYVTGFQLRVESKGEGIDNTAVNGISLSCGIAENKEVERVISAKGPWGTGRTRMFCATGPAIGFQLKVQKSQGRSIDDAATVNVKMICANGQILEGFDEQGDEYVDTVWSDPVQCPENMAICGMQTQVEPIQFLGDDTTLNNIRIKCCPLPDGSDQNEQQVPTQIPGEPFTTTQDPEKNKPIPVYKLTVFKEENGLGQNETLNIFHDQCNNLPLHWQKQVGSLASPDSCVRLWTGFDCNGNSRCHCGRNLLSLNEAYSITRGMSWFHQATSVGPCYVTGNDAVDKSASALFRNHQGEVHQLKLYPGECLTFYEGDKWRGKAIGGVLIKGCLRFYRTEDCSGLHRKFSAPLNFEGEQWRNWTISVKNCLE